MCIYVYIHIYYNVIPGLRGEDGDQDQDLTTRKLGQGRDEGMRV